jgi:hypothetical protein
MSSRTAAQAAVKDLTTACGADAVERALKTANSHQ